MAEYENNFKSVVNKWIADAFEKKKFENIDIEITGSSEKGEGYVGDVIFVKLNAVTSEKQIKVFHLVLKCGKLSEALREKMPVRFAFETEIFVYTQAIPAFRRLEERRHVNVLDNFVTTCFKTLLYEKQEVIVLQDLKALGFVLHDRYKPLDINHLRITLKNYGRWHALTMAYRDQETEKFNELFQNLTNPLKEFMYILPDTIEHTEKAAYFILEENNQFELAERLKRKCEGGFTKIYKEILQEKESNTAYLHGDCWNNNMMFKYNKKNAALPEKVVFLDFQNSTLASPVLDLSYHLYSTCSEKELLQFDELLQIYYSSLSSTLKDLGSDPEKLFPFSELVRQWKKYSIYGVIMSTTVLPIALSEKEDAPDLEDFRADFLTPLLKKVNQKSKSLISSRLISMIKHYLDYNHNI